MNRYKKLNNTFDIGTRVITNWNLNRGKKATIVAKGPYGESWKVLFDNPEDCRNCSTEGNFGLFHPDFLILLED